MYPKEISSWGKAKIFMKIFIFLFPLALLPIGFDVGTDTALLVKYATNGTNSTQYGGVTQGGILFEHSYFLNTFEKKYSKVF